MDDGTVACWGNNDHGQLGDGSLIVRTVPVAWRILRAPFPLPQDLTIRAPFSAPEGALLGQQLRWTTRQRHDNQQRHSRCGVRPDERDLGSAGVQSYLRGASGCAVCIIATPGAKQLSSSAGSLRPGSAVVNGSAPPGYGRAIPISKVPVQTSWVTWLGNTPIRKLNYSPLRQCRAPYNDAPSMARIEY